jgi:hypothetical protein
MGVIQMDCQKVKVKIEEHFFEGNLHPEFKSIIKSTRQVLTRGLTEMAQEQCKLFKYSKMTYLGKYII